MKSFFSAEDIENIAARGQNEIIIDDDAVLTDLAKRTADMLGIRIKESSHGLSQNVTPRGNPSAGGNAYPSGAKPKGCQSRPEKVPQPESSTAPARSKQVVDQLVDAVKRIQSK